MSEDHQRSGNGDVERKGNAPVRVVRDGSISSSIWERPGQDGPNYSAKIVRNWKDEDGKFHQSNSYSEYDLPRLAEVARNTRDVISGLRHEQTQKREAQGQAPSQDAPNKEQSRDAYVEQRQTKSRGSQRQRGRVQNDW